MQSGHPHAPTGERADEAGAVLRPTLTDLATPSARVAGEYAVPAGAGTIRIKITDLLSESYEVDVDAARG